MGGPRRQAAASDPGEEQETLEDAFAPCGPEDLPGNSVADSRALAS